MVAHEAAVPWSRSVSARELLAEIAGEKAARLALSGDESLRDLSRRSVGELATKGLAAGVATKILAALELGARAMTERPRRPVLSCSRDIFDLMRHIEMEQNEVFVALLLDMKNRVIREVGIAAGSLCSCVCLPRDVLRAAVREGAAHIILVHNHPSGDPTPSREDARLTAAVAQAGDIVGVKLLDHVIIGHERHFSFKDNGLIP